jgi:polygalacturonase
MRAGFLVLLAALASFVAGAASAESKQLETEPKFPPTCIVLRAGATIQLSVQSALDHCTPYHAVELAPGKGSNGNKFVIGPITLPPKISLIVDGGVTVYGSSDARLYQIPPPPTPNILVTQTCGTVGDYPIRGICKPLISFTSDSGIYGYGVIDGQGEQPVLVGLKTIPSWWSLLTEAKDCKSAPEPADKSGSGKPCQQASPILISGGLDNTSAKNLTLYKITLRNPPFHTARLSGTHIVVWDVKVQAPWNVPNSDGFDVHGHNILIKNSIVANGDQDVALTSSGRPVDSKTITHDVTIDGLRAYGKGGIALLDDGPGFSDITIHDFAMTGDLPSVVGTTVNGVTDAQMFAEHGVHFYQALTSASDDTQGMQINTGLNSTSLPPGRKISNVSFDNVCMSDIVNPIHIGPLTVPSSPPRDGYPQISGINFSNINILKPGPQFISLVDHGSSYAPGRYKLTLQSDPKMQNGLTFKNVVFSNGQRSLASLFGTIVAEGNVITALENVYPAVLNNLDQPSGNKSWIFENNQYLEKAKTTLPEPTIPCVPSKFPFVTGELYAGLGLDQTGYNANLQSAIVRPSTMVTLYAMVQPVMSQTSQYMPSAYGSDPGLFAIGSPALKGRVTFYDHGQFIGNTMIGGNGTIATFSIAHIAAGHHSFSAVYADPEGARFYDPLNFGTVSIDASD